MLGYDAAYIQKIAEGVAVLEAQGVHNPTVPQALDAATRADKFDGSELSKPGGDRRSESFQGAVNTLKRSSTNADYLTARIARDHPAILARMKRKGYTLQQSRKR